MAYEEKLSEANIRNTVIPLAAYMLGTDELANSDNDFEYFIPLSDDDEIESTSRKNESSYKQRIRNLNSHQKNYVQSYPFFMLHKLPKPAKFSLLAADGSDLGKTFAEKKLIEYKVFYENHKKGIPGKLPTKNALNFLKRFIIAGISGKINEPQKIITCTDDIFSEFMFSNIGMHLLGWNDEGVPAAYIVKTEDDVRNGMFLPNELTLINSRIIPKTCYICIVKENIETNNVHGVEIVDALEQKGF